MDNLFDKYFFVRMKKHMDIRTYHEGEPLKNLRLDNDYFRISYTDNWDNKQKIEIEKYEDDKYLIKHENLYFKKNGHWIQYTEDISQASTYFIDEKYEDSRPFFYIKDSDTKEYLTMNDDGWINVKNDGYYLLINNFFT